MRPDLGQRITLQRRVAGQDAAGQPAEDWEDVATVWASSQPLRGRTFFAAQAAQSAVDVKFVIRWRADVCGRPEPMRVIWRGTMGGDRPHGVESAIPVGRREWIELMCVSGVRDGR